MTPAGTAFPAKITETLSPLFPAKVEAEDPDENPVVAPDVDPEVKVEEDNPEEVPAEDVN